MYDQDKQIAILLTPVSNRVLENLRKSLLGVAGSTEEKAAWRLLDIMHDTAIKGLLSADLEDLIPSEETQVSIKVIFDYVKLITPPVPALRGLLGSQNIPFAIARKVLRYADFLNFKQHIASLTMIYLLIYKFRK